jgi:hypothetical protein
MKPMITANDTARPTSERTPLRAAEGDHRHHEQRHQHQHGPGALQVPDVVVGRLAFLLDLGQLDPLANTEGVAGWVGGLKADPTAAGQLGLHPDAG